MAYSVVGMPIRLTMIITSFIGLLRIGSPKADSSLILSTCLLCDSLYIKVIVVSQHVVICYMENIQMR